MKFKGAIFDLDGTLLDSMGVWTQIDIDFLAARGVKMPPDYKQTVNRMRSHEIAVYTIERFHLQDTPEELVQEWIDRAIDAYSHTLPLKDGAYTYVSALHRAGIRLAVATSSDEELVYPALRRTGLLPMMDAVVTGNEVKADKGSPDIYIETARRIGAAPADCVVYEDIIEGIRGAAAGGFATVAVREPVNGHEDELRAEADCYIRSFQELLHDLVFGV